MKLTTMTADNISRIATALTSLGWRYRIKESSLWDGTSTSFYLVCWGWDGFRRFGRGGGRALAVRADPAFPWLVGQQALSRDEVGPVDGDHGRTWR
jgi:hypothetical protein